MTEHEWQQVWNLYNAARGLAPSQRQVLLQSSGATPDVAAQALKLFDESGSASQPPSLFDPALPGPEVALSVGARVGRYRIVEFLGRGGMGDTYSARDEDLDRLVAVKLLRRPAAPAEEVGAEQFIREARAASALSHPNIITVYEVVRAEQGAAIVMELVDGVTLRDLCGTTTTPLVRVLEIGEQVAVALSAAHAAGLVHRDVKPENIMVRADGYVKVLDFGLAQRLDADSVSHPGLPAGTFRYMAPEQASGEKLTPAADVFSLGLVLFELASGVHPFPGKTPLETMVGISRSEPAQLSSVAQGVPAELSALIARMLAKAPTARPSAAVVAERLGAIRRGQPVAPVAGGPRFGLLLLAGGLALAAAASGAGYWAWKQASAAPGVSSSTAPLLSTPFTRGRGAESQPAISPDGQRVAFMCDVDDHLDICVAPLTPGGEITRVGNPDAAETTPTWSPDGRTVAFLRFSRKVEGAEVVLHTLTGGLERTIGVLEPGEGEREAGGALRWTSDPDWLVAMSAVTGINSIFLLSARTGELRRLTTPPANHPFGDHGPAISPDGRWLVFNRLAADGAAALFLMPLGPGFVPAGPERVLPTGQPWNVTPVWTPDSRKILFASGTMRRHRLVRMAPFGKNEPQLLLKPEMLGVAWPSVGRGPEGQTVLVAAHRRHLTSIWESPLGADGEVARQLTVAPDGRDFQPSYSPDGRRFAFISDRSGFEEVWVADRHPDAIPVLWTDMRCSKVALPHWSPDSARITVSAVCDGQGDVFVIPGPRAKPIRLTPTNVLDENGRWMPPAAAADGVPWLYFTTYRTGAYQTWKMPEAGGEARALTWRPTSNPRVTADGRTLFYTRSYKGATALFRTPLDGSGGETLVLPGGDDFQIGRTGVYFPAGNTIKYLDLASNQIRVVAKLSSQPHYIFDISPDEKSVIYTRNQFSVSGLLRIEGFR